MDKDASNTFTIITWKELFDEQLIIEEGRFRLRYYSQKKGNQVIARALSRKKNEGWRLITVESKLPMSLWGSNYIFQKDIPNKPDS
jgi:hypothetical protein